MSIKNKLFTGAFAIALCTSSVLTVSNASASSSDNDEYSRKNNFIELAQNIHNRENRERQDDRQFNQRNNRQDNWQFNNRNDRWNMHRDGLNQRNDRQDNWWFNNRNDRNNGWNMRRNDNPRSFNHLPNGYRRFVSRNRTYYTQDDSTYYTYNPYSRSYVLINLPGISIGF